MDKKMRMVGGGFVDAECKTEQRNGVEVGIVEGYIASFKVEDNAFPDKFEPGCFIESIADHMSRNNRPVRFNFMHRRDPIGGFPIETVKEDERGLFGRGEIALVDERGNSIYQRARAGFLSDFSIGFFAIDVSFEDELRIITKAEIAEGSLVDDPMNIDAQVTSVKNQPLVSIDDLKGMTERELESMLSEAGLFSRKALKSVIGQLKALTRPEPNHAVRSDTLSMLQGMRAEIGA